MGLGFRFGLGWAACAWSRLSKGERKGERCERAAAMVRVSSTRPKMAPNRMSLPGEGWGEGQG